ncbi:MAG: pilus assembly protein PilM [Patescibacteria group bacterium]
MFNFGSKTTVGLHFHDEWVDLVELRKQGREVVLETYSRKPIPAGVIVNGEIKDKEQLQAVLLDAFQNANPHPAEQKNVALKLPARVVFSHIFKLPLKLHAKEVKQAVGYEAETIVPFQISELYWDYRILEKDDPKKKNASQYVLFSSVPKTIADEYAQMLESIGIHPQMFGAPIDALIRALETQLQKDRDNLIIQFGPLATNILFLKGHMLKAFGSTNEGYEKFVSKLKTEFGLDEKQIHEKWENNALDPSEMMALEHFIEKHYKIATEVNAENIASGRVQPFTDLYLTGEYVALPAFYELAKKHFPEAKIHVGDPKMNLKVDDKKFNVKRQGKDGKIPLAVYFTSAIGMALVNLAVKKTPSINLLPEKIKNNLRQKNWDFLASALAITLTLLCLGIAGALFAKHQDLNFVRAKLESDRQLIQNTLFGTRYQEIQTLFTDFNKEINSLTQIEAALFSIPTMLDEIYGVLPVGVTISALEFNDSSLSVEIQGMADTRDDLLSYQQNLKELEIVKEVSLPLSNFNDKTQIAFTLNLSLQFSKLSPYGADSESDE